MKQSPNHLIRVVHCTIYRCWLHLTEQHIFQVLTYFFIQVTSTSIAPLENVFNKMTGFKCIWYDNVLQAICILQIFSYILRIFSYILLIFFCSMLKLRWITKKKECKHLIFTFIYKYFDRIEILSVRST